MKRAGRFSHAHPGVVKMLLQLLSAFGLRSSAYGFGDYWRIGLPLEVLIIAVSIPTILIAGPP